LCTPQGHNRLKTGIAMQHYYMTLLNELYTMYLITTGNFAAKSNNEGEEDTCVKID
jgi:hypothetical protein